MDIQKAKSFFGKNMTFKKLFQYLLTKAYGRFELGICGSQDQQPLSYDDIQEIGPI